MQAGACATKLSFCCVCVYVLAWLACMKHCYNNNTQVGFREMWEIEFYCMNDRDLINFEAICFHIFPARREKSFSLLCDEVLNA